MSDRPTDGGFERGRPLFGLWSTTLIAALLIGPYAVHYISSEEPYPAVILPGGASVVLIDDDRVIFDVRSYVGFDADGVATYLDVTQLLDPIPPSHSGALVRSRFGQDNSPTRRVWVDLWLRRGAIEVPRHVPNEEDQLLAREWIDEKLQLAGLQPGRFQVWYERVEVDYSTGAELSRELIDEVTIVDR